MKQILILLFGIVLSGSLLAQGCSDAGFCSLGALKNKTADGVKKYFISLGANYGAGEEGTSTFNSYVEFGARTSNRFSYQVKLTSVFADGFLGSNFDFGDIYGYAQFSPEPSSINKLSILSGVKIPLTQANDKNLDGKPLPLDYQSSLGTFDLIEGVNYIIRNTWELNAGVQIPVIQRNRNSFFPDEYADPRAENFWPTNKFKRKADALLRAGHYLVIKKYGITLKPNLLAIYHLGDDSYENRLGKREKITGSEGLTLNAALLATKPIGDDQVEVIIATPIVVRDARPDGLTRSLVINVQYRISL